MAANLRQEDEVMIRYEDEIPPVYHGQYGIVDGVEGDNVFVHLFSVQSAGPLAFPKHWLMRVKIKSCPIR